MDRLPDEIWCRILTFAADLPSFDPLSDPFSFTSRGTLIPYTRRVLPVVCRRWQSLAQQFLYSDIRVDHDTARSLGKSFMNSMKSRGGLDRVVSTHTRTVVFYNSGEEGDLYDTTWIPYAKAAWASLCYVLSHARHLRAFSGFAAPGVHGLNFVAMAASKTLTHLSLEILCGVHSTEWIPPINSFVNLQWLCIHDEELSWPENSVLFDTDPERLPVLSLPTLRALTVESDDDNPPAGFPAPWYISPKSTFPRVTHLSISGRGILTRIDELVRLVGPTLNHLTVDWVYDDFLSSMDTTAPHLQEIHLLENCELTGGSTFDHPSLRRFAMPIEADYDGFILSLRRDLLPKLEQVQLDISWRTFMKEIVKRQRYICILEWAVHLKTQGIVLVDNGNDAFGGVHQAMFENNGPDE